ncbi:MAG: hypothetical protein GY839_08640 [candidate division Zixibacteria bacterium]|nr:hypothetical protein [candidate division Zixibacteria bacterium]
MTGTANNTLGALIIVILILITASCEKQTEDIAPALKGEYLGQALPDTIPRIFAPGFISAGFNERDAAFSPDGQEFYFSIWLPLRKGVIMVSRQFDGQWTQPQVASFSGKYSDTEPFITHDGSKLYYASNKPLDDESEAKDYDIWYVERTQTGWSNPINLGEPINSEQNEFYPALTISGTLYFTALNEKSEDIFRSELVDGKHAEPANLGDSINTKSGEFNSLISPDESYLIFSSFGRGDGSGGGDLYISFRDDNGVWTKARNMGERFNNNRLDYCPALSPDGKYLFFTASKIWPEFEKTRLKSYNDIETLHNSTRNGNSDIYWVDSKVIQSFKPE